VLHTLGKMSPSDCASRVGRPGVAKTRLEKMIETYKIPIAFRAGVGNLNRDVLDCILD